MADAYGANTTKFNAGTSDDNWIDQGLIKSSLKVWTDTYEAAALGAGSTIGFAVLPEGAVVHQIILATDALGAATFNVGDSDTSGRYGSGLDVSSSGTQLMNVVNGQGYVIGSNDGDTELLITTAGAAITGTVHTTVLYTN